MKFLQISIVFFFVLCSRGLYAQYTSEITIEKLLQTDTTGIGNKIQYPITDSALVTIYKITIPSGKSTGWHHHTIPVFAYVLQGELTVEFKGYSTKVFKENATFSEVVNIEHQGSNMSDKPLVLIAFYIGEKHKPLTVKIK